MHHGMRQPNQSAGRRTPASILEQKQFQDSPLLTWLLLLLLLLLLLYNRRLSRRMRIMKEGLESVELREE